MKRYLLIIFVFLLAGCDAAGLSGSAIPLDNPAGVDVAGSDTDSPTVDPPTPCIPGPPCTDHDPCTANDECIDGVCVGTPLSDCKPCGNCVENGKGSIRCNGADAEVCTPDAGGCLSWVALHCDDGNLCLAASCQPDVGCVYNDVSYLCDDGDACTTNTCDPFEGCLDEDIVCDDNNPCTDDFCDTEAGCLFVPNHDVCDDDDACTKDTCDPVAGCVAEPITCDDGNACTINGCDPAIGCTVELVACDDGDACTDDTCDFTLGCQTSVKVCDDNNPCTDDSCEPGVGCIYTPNSDPCDDGNVCTHLDLCHNGACGGVDMGFDCSDEDPCTDDFCHPVEGCVNEPQENCLKWVRTDPESCPSENTGLAKALEDFPTEGSVTMSVGSGKQTFWQATFPEDSAPCLRTWVETIASGTVSPQNPPEIEYTCGAEADDGTVYWFYQTIGIDGLYYVHGLWNEASGDPPTWKAVFAFTVTLCLDNCDPCPLWAWEGLYVSFEW